MASATRKTSAAAVLGSSISVVATRTGITVETLRAWERRYGFPRPARRSGGSRVYDEATVAKLQVVGRALAVGLRPGDVVPMSAVDLELLVATTKRDAMTAPPTAAENPGLGPSLDDVLGALLRDDISALRTLLGSAARALGPRAFVTSLAQPLAVRIGDLWERGNLDIRQEHVATACLSMQLRALLGGFEDRGTPPVIVLATPTGEPHGLGLDMVAVYLSALQATPRLLGIDTPVSEILRAAKTFGANAVGVAVSTPESAEENRERLAGLATDLGPGVPLWIGGRGAPLLGDCGRIIDTWESLDRELAALRPWARS